MSDLLTTTQSYHAAGLSIIPIKTDGSKSPDLSSWKQFEKQLPTEAEIRKWFGNGKQRGVAIIGGQVSGNLEILDFDAPELIDEWRELVEEAAPGLLAKLPQVETPSGGLHVYYRSSEILGNKKLAEREIEVAEGTKGARRRDGRWVKVETLIETRGEGGYVVTAGSPAACHSTGKLYELVSGDLKDIPIISERDRQILLACARSFNQYIKKEQQIAMEESRKSSTGLRPGDDFNRRGDVRSLLEKHGWKYLRKGSCGELWRRPGGDHTSATLFPSGSLYIFSSNADPFEHGRAYDPFSIYAMLEHNGDWRVAAKTLAGQGFGGRSKRVPAISQHHSAAAVNDDSKRPANLIFTEDILDGRFSVEIERAPQGKVRATLRENGEIVGRDTIILDRADNRLRFIKSLGLLEDWALQVDRALMRASDAISAESDAGDDLVSEENKTGIEVGTVSFEVKKGAVYASDKTTGEKDRWVCSELHITANTRDEHSEDWGVLLRFPDRDGVWHEWAMPTTLLNGDGREYRGELLRQGLKIGPSGEARKKLDLYLNYDPGQSVTCVARQGWHKGVFVLPGETIGEGEEPVCLQSLAPNHLLRKCGTLDEWREHVSKYCQGNSRLIFAVSAAFAAPLVGPLRREGVGFHFWGESSEGKSTALYVAGSVHGGGTKYGFLRRWRSTLNGLETTAEQHNDLLLCLDEISECSPETVDQASYMLLNGQAKIRQKHSGGLRPTGEWRLLFLSSGEKTLADHIAQSGKRVMAGQEVRIVNLPSDAGKGFGFFEELHGSTSGDKFSIKLQEASKSYYGAPLRAFLHKIVGREDPLREKYQIFEKELFEEMITEKVSGQVSRVAHHFALVAFAGELATDYGLTGWEPEEATEAAKTLFNLWIDARGTKGAADHERAVRQVKAFLEQHAHSRFQKLQKKLNSNPEDGFTYEDRVIVNRAGFVCPNQDDDGNDENRYYILPEIFRKEVCQGFNSVTVARVLRERGFLVTEAGRNQVQLRTPDGRLRPYCLRSTILCEE